MKKTIKLLSLMTLFTLQNSPYAKEPIKDPFESIENIKLKNGMNIYLAPSEDTNLTSIKVNVGVGWDAEDKTNWGVSHLLEHVLFKDKQLTEEMSYLQIIKEAGGSANGSTSHDETSYYGTIPAAKGKWLLEIVSKMLLNPNMTEANVQKEKGTVELEIGRPGPITQALGLNPADYLWPKYLREESFNKAEFNIATEDKFTSSEEQLSNQKLTLNKIITHYNNYYYPANMKLTVAGKYNREEILKFIESTWGELKPKQGLSMPVKPAPVPKLAPYIKMSAIEGNNLISLGIKVWNFNEEEKVVINSYLNYLSHRLMKDLRNKKGQTYSVSPYSQMDEDYGYAYIYLKTPAEHFTENLEKIRTSMFNHVSTGGLNPLEIQEAKDLYLSAYILKGKEADEMMNFAKTFQQIQKKEGKFTSPFSSLKNISSEKYNSIIKKFFKSEHRYEVINRNPILFPIDYVLFTLTTLILTFAGLKHLLAKEFKHDHIRWVRKVKFLPLKSLEILALICGWYLFAHGMFLVEHTLGNFDFLKSNFFISNYISPSIYFGLLVSAFQLTLSALPRKLMVMDEYLIIKSTSYYSKKIKLCEIDSVDTCKTLTYPFPLSVWIFKVGLRYHYFNLKFWKKGLMIKLKNGKAYYFSIENAEEAKNELEGFLDNKEKYEIENKAA